MNHIALYRSWRPQAFRDIVGQQHITQTLQNSLAEERLSHAYLFCGPRGTGKTTAAKVLAKAVNCLRGPAAEPCNECDACVRITSGSVVDVQEIDAASNRGVDEIRDIRDKVKFSPTEVRRKVYIIDEVHMLTTEAFNALLKTLEEPPSHVMFILATTEPHRLPATIISRCQRFDFRRVPLEDQLSRLLQVAGEEKLKVDEDAIRYIARLSDGGMRDALSLLDQAVSFAEERVTLETVLAMTGGVAADRFGELAAAMKRGETGRILEMIEEWMEEGKHAEKVLESSVSFFRDLLVFKMLPAESPAAQRLPRETLGSVAGLYGTSELFAMIDSLTKHAADMKYAGQPQTLLEVALLKAGSIAHQTSGSAAEGAAEASAGAVQAAAGGSDMRALLARIAKLEEHVAALQRGGSIAGAPSAAPVRERSHPVAPPRAKLDPAKMASFVQGKDSTEFRKLLGDWSAVLQQVRERKVTVHAWLTNGEPVSVGDGAVIVAFKNTIHRDTTEKPENKQLIEQVLSEMMGQPLRLMTVMQKDWNELLSGDSHKEAPPLVLEPSDQTDGKHKEPWINSAIEMFGEDLVVIKDE